MKFDAFCGMATAVGLLLLAALIILQPTEQIQSIANIVSWVIAGAAFWKTHQQLEFVRKQANEAKHLEAKRTFNELASNIDSLRTARAYLLRFADRFPDQKARPDRAWSSALVTARDEAEDITSQSAAAAPFGFGLRIETVMARFRRLGDRMEWTSPEHIRPSGRALQQYDTLVEDAVKGLKSLADEIEPEIDKRMNELYDLRKLRDFYAHAATH